MFDYAARVNCAFRGDPAEAEDAGKRDDIVVLLAWLASNFMDDGQIRSPSGARRTTIVLDGVTYWLVRRPE